MYSNVTSLDVVLAWRCMQEEAAAKIEQKLEVSRCELYWRDRNGN